MVGLDQQLDSLRGRVGFLCLGSAEAGDDAFGLRLGEWLAQEGVPDVLLAGTDPQSLLARGGFRGFDHVIFLDAVDFGGEPGAVVLLDSSQIASRFPQVSTHRLSLGLLAKLVESEGRTKAWLLGVQPRSLSPAGELSPPVQAALMALKALLVCRFGAGATA